MISSLTGDSREPRSPKPLPNICDDTRCHLSIGVMKRLVRQTWAQRGSKSGIRFHEIKRFIKSSSRFTVAWILIRLFWEHFVRWGESYIALHDTMNLAHGRANGELIEQTILAASKSSVLVSSFQEPCCFWLISGLPRQYFWRTASWNFQGELSKYLWGIQKPVIACFVSSKLWLEKLFENQ